jgi:hypothetical protein
MSAVLLYFTVLLLSRVRPNVHVPPEEPERAVTPPTPQDDGSEAEGAGEGSSAQVRNRSQQHGERGHDVLRRMSVISLSGPDD